MDKATENVMSVTNNQPNMMTTYIPEMKMISARQY